MFLAMIIISVIDLYLSKSKQEQLSWETIVVRNAYDKMQYGTRARSAIRIMMNMANGYEPSTSQIIPNKVQYVNESIEYGLNGLIRI